MLLNTKIYGDNIQGKDIVLLHGTGARAEMWDKQIKLLVESGHRCIVPDLRGHGDTHEPGDKADIEAHLLDIIETFDAMDLEFPAVWAGHSLGAIISLELAQKRPDMFKRILAIAMPGRVPALTTEAFKWFLGWPYNRIKESGIHRSLGWRPRVLVETNRHTLEQIMINFGTIDYCSNIPNVDCPVHFVVGRLDPVAPYVYATKMHRSMPNSTLRIIEWAGHNCMDSQPSEFNTWFFEKVHG